MKQVKYMLAAALGVAASFAATAADYFNVGSDKAKYVTTAVWAPVDQTAQNPQPLETPAAGNTYWIVDGNYQAGTNTSYATGWFVNSKNQAMPGTLCVGSPTGHPVFGQRSGTLEKGGGSGASMKATINWYNGTLVKAGYYANTYLLGSVAPQGVINVLDGGAGATHTIRNNSHQSTYSMAHIFECPLVCDDPAINISIACKGTGTEATALAHNSFVRFSGDNSQYKGSFSLDTAYFSLELNGMHPLGDPNTPNAAALTICDKGVISCSATSQSVNRGIRLTGDSFYIFHNGTGGAICSPITCADGAAGKLIKIGTGSTTLACAWNAGDIEVKTGSVILDADATFPAGQKFKVCDGATLEFKKVLEDVVVTVEGSGQVIYPEGWRLNADNAWEVKVTLTTDGAGTVTGDAALTADSWAVCGSTVTLTATPDAGNSFLNWTGDVGKIADGRAMATSVRIKADAPLALCAHFGTLTQPTDVTDTDGTTFVFADRVLTVTVPDGVANAYDYVSAVTSGYVTNIVKQGTGTLTLKEAAYCGDWDIAAGVVSLGVAGGLGADNCGTVNVRSGAALWCTANALCSTGKAYTFAGTGIAGSVGAFRTTVSAADPNEQIVGSMTLAADATFGTPKGIAMRNSTIDVAGHVLTVASAQEYGKMYIEDCTVTNSSATAGTVQCTTKYGQYFLGDNTWGGAAKNNTLLVGNNHRVKLTGPNRGDWTMKADGGSMHISGQIASTDGEPVLTTTWEGPFNANGKAIYVARKDQGANGFVTFGGPISGNGTIYVFGGCIWLADANTFSGTVAVSHPSDQRHSKITPGLWLGEDANFSCGSGKVLSISDGGLHLADGSEYAIPAITCVTNATLSGGAKLTVGDLVGFPSATVENTAALEIANSWTVTMAAVNAGTCLTLTDGSLTFAPGATFTATRESGERLEGKRIIAHAKEGVSGLPSCGAGGLLRIKDTTDLLFCRSGFAVIVR